MKPEKVNRYFLIVFIFGAFIAFFGTLTAEALCFIGIVIMLGSIVLRMILYRCPHCGGYLDRGSPVYCPRCGKKVNE